MKNTILLTAIIILAMTNVAIAADLSGTWQGAIKYQHVLKLSKKPDGGYHGEWFNLGQEQEGTLNGNPISSVDFDGSHLKFTPALKSTYYEGDLSADGNTLTGTWGRAPHRVSNSILCVPRRRQHGSLIHRRIKSASSPSTRA